MYNQDCVSNSKYCYALHVYLYTSVSSYVSVRKFLEVRLTVKYMYRDNTELNVIDKAANDEKAH